LEESILEVLEQLNVPIEIVASQTCFGQTYYHWCVRPRRQQGVATSFPEALHEALNVAVASPSSWMKGGNHLYHDSS